MFQHKEPGNTIPESYLKRWIQKQPAQQIVPNSIQVTVYQKAALLKNPVSFIYTFIPKTTPINPILNESGRNTSIYRMRSGTITCNYR